MMLGNYIESSLNISDQYITVFHLNSELFLQGLVHMDWCLDICRSSLISPVSSEWNRNSLYYMNALRSICRDRFGLVFDGRIW